MKFVDFLNVPSNAVFDVVWEDGDKSILRIHDDQLECLVDGEWVQYSGATIGDLFRAQDIKFSWVPGLNELVYFVDFTESKRYGICYYCAKTKKGIDYLYSLGLVFETKEELIKALKGDCDNGEAKG